MGSVISTIRDTLNAARDVMVVLSSLSTKYKALRERIASAPGLPVPEPTSSYWLDDPPFPDLVDMQNDVPAAADVVVIGSGITAAASARAILELTAHLAAPPTVVVLEARQVCGGATGRNGGHIKTAPYEVYGMMKKRIGKERALEVVRFQMRHLGVLLELGDEFPLGEVREVETVDLFLGEGLYRKAVGEVEELKGLIGGEFEAKVCEGAEARKMFDVNEHVKGAISYKAGALWPYRLVTSVWDDLIRSFPNLSITTHAAVESVTPSSSDSHPFEVKSVRGTVQARHVLHATNGFATQLLPPSFRSSLTGALAHMSAQKPGDKFPKYGGGRSWSVMSEPAGLEYITQRPGQDGRGDLMIGGGFLRSKDQGLDQFGVWDDGRVDALPLMHIRGCMQTVFEPNWGMGGGMLKAWTGILGFTGDFMPLVGRVQNRQRGNPGVGDRDGDLAAPGEWVAAGYCGEGMVWAWLCGTAIGVMIAGREDEALDEVVGRPGGKLAEWFPRELGLDSGRLQRADLKHLARELA